MEWQPIETVQHQDTEPVLLFTTEGVELAWWSAHNNGWLSNDGHYLYGTPTHWVPLPNPPATEKETA
jgi:hypothetical protein